MTHTPLHALVRERTDQYYRCYYQNSGRGELNALCDLHGSDKGEIRGDGHPYPWPSHTYADFIERLFWHSRSFVKNVFECGIGTNKPDLKSSMGVDGRPGASLRMWRDYFPNASILGADIDPDILFSEERIATEQCDQTDPASIAALWSKHPDIEFDLMIDDGLHEFEANRILWENAFHRLRDGGIYLIEDVKKSSLLKFADYLGAKGQFFDLVTLHRQGMPLLDNSLVVIRK